ncbi:murein hydrolase activator EnvC family protein [Microbacterium gorillae]|uniref:murein hydrolase activator EnvC family protein n=1 Tax=Microbacterium gorillae TaxID=1231063 RepID=UPI003D9611D5
MLGIAVMLLLVGNASASMAASMGTPARADLEPLRLVERGSAGPVVTLPGHERWSWPIEGAVRVTRPFLAPPHAYGAGHRGIDLVSLAGGSGVVVRAPSDGVIAFVGTVVDRPLLTIDHGDGLVTTLEPVRSDLAVGALVRAAEDVGTIASGGHTANGELHFGVRLNGEYINPLLLLGGVPRAILLPCCSDAGSP